MSSIPRISACTRISASLAAPSVLGAGAVAGAAIATGCALPVAAAMGMGMWALCKGGKKWFAGGNAVKPAAFIAVEKLTKPLELGGGIMDLSIPPVLSSLKKLPGGQYAKAIACLENMMLYLNHFNYTGFGNGGLIDYQQRVIRALQPGQSTAIPCSWFAPTNGIAHVMVLGIECTEDGQYKVTIYNGGDGAQRESIQGEGWVRAYVVEEVRLAKLLKLIPQLVRLHTLHEENSSNKLYSELLPVLNGVVIRPEKGSSLYAHPQSGDSCSGYSVHLFLKAILSEQEYYEFEKQFCRDRIEELKEGLQSRFRIWEQTIAHVIVLQALEGRVQLLESRGKLQDLQKITFAPHSLLPRNPRLGRMAYLSQRLFWDIIFWRPSSSATQDMDYWITGARLMALWEAGERDYDKLVEISEGGKIDDSVRESLMYAAVKENNDRLFDFLFQTRSSIPNWHPRKILLGAIQLNHQEAIDFLESWITQLPFDEQKDALLGAIKNRNFALIKKLKLDKAAGISLEFNKAVDAGDYEMVQSLLPFQKLSPSDLGKALLKALEQKDYALCAILYDGGPICDITRGWALWEAQKQGNQEWIEKLSNPIMPA